MLVLHSKIIQLRIPVTLKYQGSNYLDSTVFCLFIFLLWLRSGCLKPIMNLCIWNVNLFLFKNLKLCEYPYLCLSFMSSVLSYPGNNMYLKSVSNVNTYIMYSLVFICVHEDSFSNNCKFLNKSLFFT